jgi:hypothetical protein
MTDANQTPEQIIEKLKQALTELSGSEHVDSNRTVNFHAKKGETNYGKGITWTGQGPARQIIFSKPDCFWSSDHFDLAPGKSYYVAGSPVLNQTALGSSVTKSSLKELGRLSGLIVDGSVSINQHFYYDAKKSSLGLGNERPEALLDIAKNSVNLTVDIKETTGLLGTKSAHSVSIVSSDVSRITVSKDGNIQLGNKEHRPVQVSIHGKLAVKVEHPDPDVDLHVSGPVRLHGRLYAYADQYPKAGVGQQGDIVWNSNPTPGKPIGWVCVKAGSPGTWASFGMINHLG